MFALRFRTRARVTQTGIDRTLGKFVTFSYLLSFLGVLLDQISTRFGLGNLNLIEMNPYVVIMMEYGIWIIIDLIAVLVTILFTHYVIKFWNFKFRQLLALFPFSFGVLKLVTGLSNIILIISVTRAL
jgi:hypothetical protein